MLASGAAGLLGSIAGCLAPQADTGDRLDRATASEDDRTSRSAFSSVYDSAIDAVTLVRVFGIDDSTSDDEQQGQSSGFVYDER